MSEDYDHRDQAQDSAEEERAHAQRVAELREAEQAQRAAEDRRRWRIAREADDTWGM